MTGIAASGLPVQEIWDQIIDYVASYKALASSSLVCRSFVVPAQRNLFHEITVVKYPKASPDDLVPTIAAKRLPAIIANSPHLLTLVRSLRITRCDKEILTPIAGVAWSHLHTISLEQPEGADLPLIIKIASLPCLRKLQFAGYMWAKDLHIVLAHCSPALQGLSFYDCYLIHKAVSHDLRNPQRPRITYLDMALVPGLPKLLLDSASLVDFSSLTHFKFGYFDEDLIKFLRLVRHTIQNLDFVGLDNNVERLDLSEFTALSHVTLRGVGEGFQRGMERSGASTVRTMCCPLRWMSSGNSARLSLLESILVAKMPLLQRVEMQITALNDRDKISVLVKKQMPQIVGKGILVIGFV
ncbi:hypothetical protein B0H19DRAFT_1257728 [Mycena capillaripes]|nr:hypothetical protein B0H19DRAFT_1257728 [Mycena capillaripes]